MSGLSDRCGTHTGLLTCNHLQPTSGETLRHPTLTTAWKQAKLKSRSHYHQSDPSAFILSPDALGKNQTPGRGFLASQTGDRHRLVIWQSANPQ